jgi:hypothetical protein
MYLSAANEQEIAGCLIDEFSVYTYTNKVIDYLKYFGYAGLNLEKPGDDSKRLRIKFLPNPNPPQSAILNDRLKD